MGDTINISINSTAASQLGSSENGQLSDINVLTDEGAQAALDITDQALEQINTTRSQLGAQQNQLTSSISNLATSRVNTLAAESNIRDLDFAEESMNIAQIKSLQKIRIFAATQANSTQKNVLSLLHNQI